MKAKMMIFITLVMMAVGGMLFSAAASDGSSTSDDCPLGCCEPPECTISMEGCQ